MCNHQLHPFQQRFVTKTSKRPLKPDSKAVETRRRIEEIKERQALEKMLEI